MQVPDAQFVKNTHGEWVLKLDGSAMGDDDYSGMEAEALRLLRLYQPLLTVNSGGCTRCQWFGGGVIP